MEHYRNDGGDLPRDWVRGSQLLDLVNLCALLVRSSWTAPRRTLRTRIEDTLRDASV